MMSTVARNHRLLMSSAYSAAGHGEHESVLDDTAGLGTADADPHICAQTSLATAAAGAGVRLRSTHWRRLERWRQAGVLDRLHSSVRRAARGWGIRHKVRRSGKGYGSDPNRRDLRTMRRIPCVAG